MKEGRGGCLDSSRRFPVLRRGGMQSNLHSSEFNLEIYSILDSFCNQQAFSRLNHCNLKFKSLHVQRRTLEGKPSSHKTGSDGCACGFPRSPGRGPAFFSLFRCPVYYTINPHLRIPSALQKTEIQYEI
jgi:hypothetical protein